MIRKPQPAPRRSSMFLVFVAAAIVGGCAPLESSDSRPLGGDADPLAEVRALLEDILHATRFRFSAVDDRGARLDGLKVIEDRAGGYLGVCHALIDASFRLRLLRSTDLMSWTLVRELDDHAGMPDLAE